MVDRQQGDPEENKYNHLLILPSLNIQIITYKTTSPHINSIN